MLAEHVSTGTGVGTGVGTGIGTGVVGTGVGTVVGAGIGTAVGAGIGTGVGAGIGTAVGAGIGAAVGVQYEPPSVSQHGVPRFVPVVTAHVLATPLDIACTSLGTSPQRLLSYNSKRFVSLVRRPN